MKNEKKPTCKYCLDKEEEVKKDSLPLPRTLIQTEIDEIIEEMAELIRENKRLEAKRECTHEKYIGGVCVKCDYIPFREGEAVANQQICPQMPQEKEELAAAIKEDMLDNIIGYIYHIGAGISVTRDEPMTPQRVKEFFIREKDEIKEHFVEKAAVREIIPQEAELEEDERGYILNRPDENQRNRGRRYWVGGYNKALNDVRAALEEL